MPWLQLKLDTHHEHAERISDLLSELGAVAVTFEDASDQPIFEPDPGETRLWNSTRVIGLFAADTDMEGITNSLTSHVTPELMHHLHIDPLEDKDWERAWMDNFKPIRFGKKLWICPSWHTPSDTDAVNIMLDPGLAFGTGTHPTTRLCLEWLDEHAVPQEVIDYGCGSGILAIAAAKLGAEQIECIDTDPQALEA
ncbi:MAG: 50S ribosomal protein L11 methyltransferase, partial [Gammaproteobacteria bacterium]|nr:50S ribosomal protein L11 methyltransferase [Gammaproteobacteria bacterium]